MEGITLQLRLDGESAELFTNQLLAFAKKQVKEQLENDRMPINQQALMKKFGFTHGYIKKLERKGLRFRKTSTEIESIRRKNDRTNFSKPISWNCNNYD